MGFTTIDADCLCQSSKRPFHLESRFSVSKEKFGFEAVLENRDRIIAQIRARLQTRFVEDKRIILAAKARQKSKTTRFLSSLANAEQNRNHHLECRRSINKQLVDRAKQIAHQHRVQKSAETENRRIKLELRLQQSEKRRLAFLGQTSKPHFKSMESEQVKKLLSNFHQLGLPILDRKETWVSFSELSNLIQQQHVTASAGSLLGIILNDDIKKQSNNSRVFLSAYMIVTCRNDVMQYPEDTKNLVRSATSLLEQFENLSKQPCIHLKDFKRSWNVFLEDFNMWRDNDRGQLIKGMVDYFLELRKMHRVMDDVGLKCQLRKQLQDIKNKLYRLGGPQAITLLKEEKSNSIVGEPPATELDNKRASTDVLNRTLIRISDSFKLTASQIAHELIVDPQIKLQSFFSPETQLDARIQSNMRKAYFDNLRIDLANRMYKPGLLSVLNTIREKLSNMVLDGQHAHTRIQESFDMKLIEQAIDNGDIDIGYIVSSIVSCIKQLCAPIRDMTVAGIDNTHDPIGKLELIMPLLDDMLIDLANFQLRSIQPILSSIAVEYEQMCFQELAPLRDASCILQKLPLTYRWLNCEYRKWKSIELERHPENPSALVPTSMESLFYEGCITLLIQERLEMPETWRLDMKRWGKYRQDFHRLVITSSLLMVARNSSQLTKPKFFQLHHEIHSLLKKHSTCMDCEDLQAKLVHCMGDCTTLCSSLPAMVKRILRGQDSVFMLLQRRLLVILKNCLMTHVPATKLTLTKSNLGSVMDDFNELFAQVDSLTCYHLKVHRPWYNAIMSTIHK
ncbi:Tcp11-domain-containing protein [Hesseltinella vesiculosa]|uniref:Tcp11-domain-containing protein n=1 Tax=Hesseltinella vesiculosa TaxID=101127 RepID=A0A1X2GEA3_9FUNG|nr:Tcp11-domain-containing protein [Hesseltinella vesiculosa]